MTAPNGDERRTGPPSRRITDTVCIDHGVMCANFTNLKAEVEQMKDQRKEDRQEVAKKFSDVREELRYQRRLHTTTLVSALVSCGGIIITLIIIIANIPKV